MAIYRVLTRNGVADDGQEKLLSDLATELAKPDAKLLLHLHGGLVPEKGGIETAERLSGKKPDGWALGSEWTQVYVVWRTGAFESIASDWETLVRDDRLYQAILRRLLAFAARKLAIPLVDSRGAVTAPVPSDEEILRRIVGDIEPDAPFTNFGGLLAPGAPPGTRAATLGPQSDGALAIEFQGELPGDLLFEKAVGDIDALVNARADGRTALAPADSARGAASFARLDGTIQAELMKNAPDGTPGRRGPVSVAAFILKHATQIAFRTFKRFRSHRDHGLHATIVEELCRELYGDIVGAGVWGLMTKHAADHFGATGYGATLVGLLAAHPPTKIVVTAHSAGSIWASHLLIAMQQEGVRTPVELFLLAPAVRQSLFAQAISQAGAQVGRCRMLTMGDELERKDAVLGHDKGFIYPSSLLYLVSGLFENSGAEPYADAPILGMARFASPSWLNPAEQKEAQAIAAFFQQPDKGIVHSPEVGVTMADSHGDFDSEHETLATVLSLF